jgi:hypothetical protein
VNASEVTKETLGLLMAGIVPEKIEKEMAEGQIVETTF